jgi:hypothetical protein
MIDRYYVQPLTDFLYLVRERQAGSAPHPKDRIVCHFEKREDAQRYAQIANEAQRKLDDQFGYWTQSAV